MSPLKVEHLQKSRRRSAARKSRVLERKKRIKLLGIWPRNWPPCQVQARVEYGETGFRPGWKKSENSPSFPLSVVC